jgi:hypothetical protein
MFHSYDVDKEPNAYEKAADIYTGAINTYEGFGLLKLTVDPKTGKPKSLVADKPTDLDTIIATVYENRYLAYSRLGLTSKAEADKEVVTAIRAPKEEKTN